MQIQIDHVQLEAVQGDIANQPDMTAVVNAANARLEIGGGVAGANIVLLVRGLLKNAGQWPR
ncbi:MAG: hypothetical protein V5A47_02130 [Bacteroidales bacterium]